MVERFEIITDRETSFTQSFATNLSKNHLSLKILRFADTETYIKLPDAEMLKNKSMLFIFQFKGCQQEETINQRFIELCMAVDYLKKAGVKEVIVMLPYLPYARQEYSFYGRYEGSLSLVSKFLKYAGVDGILSCDVHSKRMNNFFQIPFIDISLSDFWGSVVNGHFLASKELSRNEICLVAPDQGAVERVEAIAQKLHVPMVVLKKERNYPDRSEILDTLSGNPEKKHAIIVDDIINTGTTAIAAAHYLKKKGALTVNGCFSHAVLSSGAQEKLKHSPYEKIFLANTLSVEDSLRQHRWKVLDIGSFVAAQVCKQKL